MPTHSCEFRRYEEAALDYEALLRLDPNSPYACGTLAFCRLHTCDWRNLDGDRAALAAGLLAGKRMMIPFQSLALSPSRSDQLACARATAADKYPAAQNPLWRGERYSHERIRLAYLSADFNHHAVATLMAGVFEHHDRTRFETIAVSLTNGEASDRRRRLQAAFDRFIEVGDMDNFSAASLLRELEIDIAVDLMGDTGECRPEILAFRPVSVQVGYLGCPALWAPRASTIL